MGGGGGSGFGARGLGTVAPRAGGQCAATKTRRKDNAQGRFSAWCSVPRPVGLTPVDFAMPRLSLGNIFSTTGKNEFRPHIHHSDFKSGKWQEQGSFFFWGGGTPLLPLRTHTRLTYFSSIIFHRFFTYPFSALIGKFLFEPLRWIICVIVSCVAPTFLAT